MLSFFPLDRELVSGISHASRYPIKGKSNQSPKLTLSQWMGCARHIWNAKCEEERYYTTFARKYCPIGVYAPIDQKTSQFKSKELTPWLYDVLARLSAMRRLTGIKPFRSS